MKTTKSCIKKVGTNKLRDALGRYKTVSLFYELAIKQEEAKWTMKEEDRMEKGIKYPSLKAIYLAMDHIPYNEYEFAEKYFGSWEHWDRLSNESDKRLVTMVSGWRTEMEVKLRAAALKQIIAEGKSGGASALAAAKYIAEKGYDKKAGRPTKASIAKETKVQSGIATALLEDAERIGLESELIKVH